MTKKAKRAAIAPALTLLKYQQDCFRDRSRFKLLEWARGARKTFTVTLEIVDDCFLAEAKGHRTTWLILSRGERQAQEAMNEARRHYSAYLIGGNILESEFVSEDGKRRFTQLELRFPNGSRIIALPANPDTARGYTANIFLDEFCIHDQDVEIWRALLPVLRGRFRVIVASTPKGGRTRKFYQLVHDDSGLWHKHIVDIYEAIRQGLKINIEEERTAMGDPDGWAQEFELQWLDEASAWLPFELIESCEDEAAGLGDHTGGQIYVGNDIARRKDLWVAWVLERVGDVLWTREVVELKGATFAEHDQAIADIFRRYRVTRLALDQTGMGEKVLEDYQRIYGKSRVEGVLFSQATKQAMALLGRRSLEDRRVRLPVSSEIRNDLYKLRRIVTPSGGIRFDAEADDQGHADRAWALFLALSAAQEAASSFEFTSIPRDRSADTWARL